MTDTKRTLFAGLLIGLLTLSIPFYLNLIGIAPSEKEHAAPPVVDGALLVNPVAAHVPAKNLDAPLIKNYSNHANKELLFEVVTEKYNAVVSNRGGGSLERFSLHDSQKDGYKYIGGYNDFGEYDSILNVELSLPSQSSCNPCLGLSTTINNTVLVNAPFQLVSPSFFDNQTINLYGSDSLLVTMTLLVDDKIISKTTTFYADSYVVNHSFDVNPLLSADGTFSVLWKSGIRPTEKNLFEELTYSEGFAAHSKNIKSVSLSPSSANDVKERTVFKEKTDWVALRNKYFINSLISSQSTGSELSARAFELSDNTFVPVYEMGLHFLNSPRINVKQFFGPLDVDVIVSSNTYLDRVMNFGWLPIQPFSRSVLWILKKLHLVGLNYGLILILFAFIIRVITGPLTKKSFKSTQKMQTIQPQLKKIQEKYKNDSARLNREMMNLYKTHGVNPLGGCLPMLIQMPLLFALFVVFRSTIEFRGAPFFGWISNLSQPDTIFNLPFNIPIYGDQVAFLPIVLGISMFMSQRLSMATMDKSQKPMMYIMSAFFFLLFNSFPSGLNLYYTVYNLLNYQQQKAIRGK